MVPGIHISNYFQTLEIMKKILSDKHEPVELVELGELFTLRGECPPQSYGMSLHICASALSGAAVRDGDH